MLQYILYFNQKLWLTKAYSKWQPFICLDILYIRKGINMTVKDKHTAATNILEGATKHKYKSTVIHS